MAKLMKVRCVLAVTDLKSSVAFYCDKLGFKIESEFDGWCFISRDTFELMLGDCPAGVPASQIDDHSYFAYVEVQKINTLHEEFTARGLTSLPRPESKPWGMLEFMVVTPDGHRIMFGQNITSHQ